MTKSMKTGQGVIIQSSSGSVFYPWICIPFKVISNRTHKARKESQPNYIPSPTKSTPQPLAQCRRAAWARGNPELATPQIQTARRRCLYRTDNLMRVKWPQTRQEGRRFGVYGRQLLERHSRL